MNHMESSDNNFQTGRRPYPTLPGSEHNRLCNYCTHRALYAIKVLLCSYPCTGFDNILLSIYNKSQSIFGCFEHRGQSLCCYMSINVQMTILYVAVRYDKVYHLSKNRTVFMLRTHFRTHFRTHLQPRIPYPPQGKVNDKTKKRLSLSLEKFYLVFTHCFSQVNCIKRLILL
jgi:hypothetical protein